MIRIKSLGTILVLAWSALAIAQTAKPAANPAVSQVFNDYVNNAQKKFVSAAEAMPEDKYSFAPTSGEFKGVRTFAAQVKHVAATNYLFGSAILQEKSPVDLNDDKGPDAIKSKADILKYLNDSFIYLHGALNSLTQQNLVDPIKNPFGEGSATRLKFALFAVGHPWDHYGQVIEYLRMNGIVPPASR